MAARAKPRSTSRDPDPVDDWIRMVAINRLTGHSPGFFSVYTLPPNQAVAVESQGKINAKRDQIAAASRCRQADPARRRGSLLGETGHMDSHPTRLSSALDARDASGSIPDASVALVVTSPPFLDIVHYAADNWLRCWFAGIDVDTRDISMASDRKRRGATWSPVTLTEQARIVRPRRTRCL